MIAGIIAGITWAIETVVLGIALDMEPLKAIAIATFISTFLHDTISAICATVYNAARGNLGNVWKALRTKSGKFVVLAAVIGGPVGMTGYVMAVKYMGASIGAVASAIFPAIGAVLAYFFLKEKMKWYQWIFLIATLGGVYGLSYSPELEVTNYLLGILGALMCAFGWGIEAVILAKCLHDPEVTDEYALQIRQTTSAIVIGVVILPIVRGWGQTADLFKSTANLKIVGIIAIAGLFATVSYLFYYKAISQIGASKSMALNVTYCAWATVFTVVILRDTSVLKPVTIICSAVVLVCGILAATDFKLLFSKNK